MNNDSGMTEIELELRGRLTKAREIYKKHTMDIKILKRQYENLERKYKALEEKYKKLTTPADIDIIEKIYSEYPKQFDKRRSMEAIRNAVKRYQVGGGGTDDLLNAVQQYAACLKRFGVNKTHELWRFVPACITWFDREYYLMDEPQWSANFRKGKYIEEKIEEPIPPELERWKEAVEAITGNKPRTDLRWDYFYMHHRDMLADVKGWLLKNPDGTWGKDKIPMYE